MHAKLHLLNNLHNFVYYEEIIFAADNRRVQLQLNNAPETVPPTGSGCKLRHIQIMQSWKNVPKHLNILKCPDHVTLSITTNNLQV